MISALVELLGNFYARNDFTNFEAVARSLLATIPNDQVALQFLGLVYYRTGRVEDAIEVFDQVQRQPAVGDAGPVAGSASATHVETAAEVCYQEATRNNAQLARTWYDVGTTLLALGKLKQAVRAFRSALTAAPESTQAMLAVGQTALRVDDLAAAEEGFSRLREVQPNNAEVYRGLGQLYRKRRDFATARACWRRVRILLRGLDSLRSKRRSKRPCITAEGE